MSAFDEASELSKLMKIKATLDSYIKVHGQMIEEYKDGGAFHDAVDHWQKTLNILKDIRGDNDEV